MKAIRISLITVAASVLTMVEALACEVCKKQQPKVLRGITHGAGPQSDWDYVVVGCAVILVLISLFYAVKWIMHPGEKEREHVKNSIFN